MVVIFSHGHQWVVCLFRLPLMVAVVLLDPLVTAWTVCYRFHTFTTNPRFRNLDLIVKIYYDRSSPAQKPNNPNSTPKGAVTAVESRLMAGELKGTGYASKPKPPKSRNASSKESLRTTSASTMNLGPPSTGAGCATSA